MLAARGAARQSTGRGRIECLLSTRNGLRRDRKVLMSLVDDARWMSFEVITVTDEQQSTMEWRQRGRRQERSPTSASVGARGATTWVLPVRSARNGPRSQEARLPLGDKRENHWKLRKSRHVVSLSDALPFV